MLVAAVEWWMVMEALVALVVVVQVQHLLQLLELLTLAVAVEVVGLMTVAWAVLEVQA